MTSAAALLAELPLDVLETDTSTLVCLTPDGVIAWVNAAWWRFAEDNGAPEIARRFGVGARYLDGVSGELRPWCEEVFKHAQDSGEPFVFDYECSSPSRVRRFRMRVLPIKKLGLLLEHALLVDAARADGLHAAADDPAYRSRDGFVRQCSNCRKVRKPEANRWDVVLAWIERSPPRTSHGLCGACYAFYYPEEPLAVE